MQRKRQFKIKVTVTFTISVNFVTQLPLPVMKCTRQSQNTVLTTMYLVHA